MHENVEIDQKTGLTTWDKVGAVKQLVADGYKVYRACKKVGISKETYHAYIRQEKAAEATS